MSSNFIERANSPASSRLKEKGKARSQESGMERKEGNE